MPHTPDRKSATRRRILASARRLFSAHGYEATAIEDVMGDCGLTRGGFYAHFPSKAALYREAMEAAAGITLIAADSTQWLDALFDACLGARSDDTSCWRFLGTDIARQEAAVRVAYARHLRRLHQRLAAGAGADEEAAWAATALFIGALAVAMSIDDPALRHEVVSAARRQARLLIETEAAAPTYLWAQDYELATASRRGPGSGLN